MPEAYNFFKKEALAQLFSFEFCEISKNTFFYRTPLMAASDIGDGLKKYLTSDWLLTYLNSYWLLTPTLLDSDWFYDILELGLKRT